MSSFYAELTVAGQVYPVRYGTYSFSQPTEHRGRVAAKVRHGRVQLLLDVPDGDLLAVWAATPHKLQAGHVTFFEANRRTARETLAWEAGECVSYREEFRSGDAEQGAYVCHLTIAAPRLTLQAGGAGQYVPPAAGQHGVPPLAPLAAAVALPPALALPATLPLNKQGRYVARMHLMQRARTGLAATPNDAAQTALTRLERNNVAVERARLSEHVYHSDKAVAEPEGWHMFDKEELAQLGVSPTMLLDPKSGFKAAIYQSDFEQPPKLVIAYAGTEDKKDIMADLKQGLGLEEKQYNEAMRLVKTVVSNMDKDAVETTGHSLGGGLASAATVVTGTKGYTFNAAGLHVNTVNRPPYEVSRAAMQEQAALTDAYRSTSDPLNNAQKAAVVTRGAVLPKALGVPHLLTPAPPWQHKWSELVKGNPLKAAKAMALDGHGISPQMVDHIEHEKDQDTPTLTQFVAP